MCASVCVCVFVFEREKEMLLLKGFHEQINVYILFGLVYLTSACPSISSLEWSQNLGFMLQSKLCIKLAI